MYRSRTGSLFALAIITAAAIALLHFAASSGLAQRTAPKPSVPPGNFPTTTSTGTVNPTAPTTSKLMLFTVNGGGTTVTKTNGEFGSTLAAAATVGKEFALQWSRTKAGKAEKGAVYLIPPGSGAWVKVQDVTMPAQSTSIDIQYSMPNLSANTYGLIVSGEAGNSTRVTVKYNGKGGEGPSVVIKPGPTPGQVAASKGKVTRVKFTPIIGSPNDPGYKSATLSLTLEADSDWTIKEVAAEVYSEPFISSEIVTSSGSKNAPIKLFTGSWKMTAGASFTVHPGTPKVIFMQLSRTSKGQVAAQESGPGIYSANDWKIAFAQTATASFRWTIDGKPSGSAEQSPKKQWQQP